jgi:two-component system, NtrC family, response regulator AtoC
MNTILVTGAEPEVRTYLGLALSSEGFYVEFAYDGEEAIAYLSTHAPDVSVLLLDLVTPFSNGLETLKQVRRTWPDLPVIALSSASNAANPVSVLKAGAHACLAKPVEHEDLLRAVQSALEESLMLRNRGGSTQSRLHSHYPSSDDTWSERLGSLLDKMAASDVPVLLRGETGVGKEVLARKLHALSERANRPFVKLNCAALPSELIESELFGYERGAFTGAFKNTPGKFEMANGGTLLLDEIGDMDFKLQAKLLHVLQDREFHRLGSKDTSRVDVRVMAATHCDLEAAIAEKRFRQDLFYRLNIIEIDIPPLRERRDEILSLSETFVRKYGPGGNSPVEIPAALQRALLEHDWPGNVRELENVIRKYLVFQSVDQIMRELQQKSRKRPSAVLEQQNTQLPEASVQATGLEDVATLNALESAQWSREQAAKALQMDFSTLLNRMKALAIQPEPTHVPRFVDTTVQPTSAPPSILKKVDYARKEAETEAILAALNSTLWNRKQAATLLRIDYKALLYKMKKLGIGDKSDGLQEAEILQSSVGGQAS